MIKKHYGILTIVAVMVAAFVSTDISYANYFGGKFPHTPGSVKTIYYKYNNPHRYNGNVWQGAANWRNGAARIKPTPGTSNIKITVIDAWQNGSFYGLTWINPCASCSYTSAGYYLYQKKMDPLNDFDRTYVATHEFGHTLGLAHTTGSSSSVMKTVPTGFPAYNTPMPYDKNQINALYN